MPSPNAAIDEIAGYLGIGFLQILGLFLILDGLTGFMFVIETYSKTNSWLLFVSISLIAVAYLIGIISTNVMSTFFTKHSALEKDIINIICKKDKEILYELFRDYRKSIRFIRGSLVGVVLLAAGSTCEAYSGFMQQWTAVGYAGAVMALGFIPLAIFTMNRMSSSMLATANAANI